MHSAEEGDMSERCRLRDLGLTLGRFPTGPLNAITDVAGVAVGHATIIDDGSVPGRAGTARTGVTAILPNERNIFMDRLVASAFILNGAGEMNGLIQVQEWGVIETPILLTNTLSVGTAAQATVRYMLDRYPGIGIEHDVIIPLVGECDDSHLNDIRGHHVLEEHVFHALSSASSGPVAEGNVGGGTGMVCCDVKGGIGTSSRQLQVDEHTFTLGVLVMSNFGRLEDLRLDGLPIGAHLAHDLTLERRTSLYGSIIVVVATDAPLSSRQLGRLCTRAGLGLGRSGSYAAHGSGEIVVGFSTANAIPRISTSPFVHLRLLNDRVMNPFYQAVIECTEESIWNALCSAKDMVGVDDHRVSAVPLDRLVELHTKLSPG